MIVGQLTAGIVFAGTPHVDDKPESLRKALLNTIQAFHPNEATVDDSQIREYVTAVGKVNRAFSNMPSRPRMLSLWEEKVTGSDQQETQFGDVIVSQDCRGEIATRSTEKICQCNHADLLRFPGVYHKDFMMLTQELNSLLALGLEILELLPPIETLDVVPEEPKIRAPPNETSPDPPLAVPTPPGSFDKPSDLYNYWSRKAHAEDRKASKAAFLDSLKGWSEANTGNHISPTPGTCNWATTDPEMRRWSDVPMINRLFIIGSPGQGKTHLLKALQEQIQVSRPQDSVLSFFCSPGLGKPPLWEYFTWALLQKESWLFSEIPARYRGKSQGSERGLGSFVDIWHAFQQATNLTNSIWLLVDGLEQCGEEHFEDFLASYKELFARPLMPRGPRPATKSEPPKGPTTIKIIFTCRVTPAVIKAQATAALIFLDSTNTSNDISFYVDLKLNPMVGKDIEPGKFQSLRDRIKKSSMSFWPYAIYAVQEAQDDLLFGNKAGLRMGLKAEDDMPQGLRQWYRERVLGQIQSVTCSWLTRTNLNICLSQTYNTLTVQQLDSLLRCLGSDQYTGQVDLMRDLMINLGDILNVRSDGSISFVHPSMAWYVGELLSLEQRHTNMAFLCLQYLLQESFKRPLEMERRGITEAESYKWLDNAYPFYDYAGHEWAHHLRESKLLVEELLPLIREFVDTSCLQTKTWVKWRAVAVTHEGPTRRVEAGQQAIFALIREGCTKVLECLFSRRQPTPWYSRENIIAWATGLSSWPASKAPSRKRGYSDGANFVNWLKVTDRRGQTALMGAVISDCIDTVQLVLSYEPNLEALSDFGETALMCSLPALDNVIVEEYDSAILELLLDKGANPNTCNSIIWTTVLHQSCIAGLIQPTRLLLRHCALVDIPDINGVTPLQCAYQSGNVALVLELLDAGADPDIWWRGANTPLNRCVHDGNLSMFRVFLERADVNAISRSGLAPIHEACKEPGCLAFLELILKRPEVDVNMPVRTSLGAFRQYNGEPLTAIHLAARRGDYSAAELLLQAGADTGIISNVQYTPLHYAALCKSTSLARLLIEHNACVNAVSRQAGRKTPLSIAVSHGDEDMVALLIQHGADPTVEEGYGDVGLLLDALRTGDPNPSIVEKLLESQFSPSVNQTSTRSGHPLVFAARAGKVELVRLLLDHGADLRMWLEPIDVPSPLHIAVAGGHQDVAELLITREPELLNAQPEHGYSSQSPLHTACGKRQPEMVKFLLAKGALAHSVVYHDEQSCLLLSCTAGDHDSVEALLEAAPEMVNKPSVRGETPLSRACGQKDLRIMEKLLQAGADVMNIDSYGSSCISPHFFDRENGSVDKKLELLFKHGLDINAVMTNRGFTVLGVAIEYGYSKDVKWLIDHGADLSRCQRSPLEPVIWRNALHVACNSGRMNQVHLILETEWMSQEALRGRDWLGGGILPLGPPQPWSVEVAQAIYWACEKERKEMGNDIFAELITHTCINGLTPIDWNLHLVGCTLSAHRQLDDSIQDYLHGILARPRWRDTHTATVEEAARLLLYRGEHDLEAEFLLSLALSVPCARWDPRERRFIHFAIMARACHVCMLHNDEIAWICTFCMALYCDRCFAFRELEPLHEHRWIEIRLDIWDWNSDLVQNRLEHLRRQFGPSNGHNLSPIEEEADFAADFEAGASEETTNDQLQTSLQLATLHAFNRLAIRRPLFTPYLPLSAAVEATIAPWTALIHDQRRRVDMANLSLEQCPTRLAKEQLYLKKGMISRYVDESEVRYGRILQGIQELYKEESAAGEGGLDMHGNAVGTHDMDDDATGDENW